MDSLTLASHLEVTVEQWFDWSKSEREIYVSKLNNMSIDDLLDRKEIPDPQGEVNDMNVTEYKELGVDLSSFLQDNYSRKCLSPSKEPQIASHVLVLMVRAIAYATRTNPQQPTLPQLEQRVMSCMLSLWKQ